MKYQEEQLHWFLKTVEGFWGKWYVWGGDDPEGFDCSGLVIEGLKSAGLLDNNDDLTADGIFRRFDKPWNKCPRAKRGALAFWFNEARAYHIAVCVSDHWCITADGGRGNTLTPELAARHNAFIKYRPIRHRKTEPEFLYVFS